MPVLSKAGCNMGACHGNKLGKGGLKLSLRGEDPDADYRVLTQGLNGRRIDPAAPEDSLLLQKPSTAVPHEGGLRLKRDSEHYRTLLRWIGQRVPNEGTNAHALVSMEVKPSEKVVYEPESKVPLKVTAHFADGTSRDITRLACYESSNTLVDISPDGVVERKSPGETTILVRYLQIQKPVTLAFVPRRPFFKKRREEPANFIDELTLAKLRQLRLNASPVAPDEVFLRRAYLDLLGLPPTEAEARVFVADGARDKRARLVDRLLERPEFADNWALKWADLLHMDERTLDTEGVALFHGWIRESFASNKPLNQFARELIAARGSTYTQPPANFYRALRTPVERAEASAQIFLGTRLQCAQCHNHPYERWTQDDYHDWTGLFARVDYAVMENKRRDENDSHEFIGEQIVQIKEKGEHMNPRTGMPADPRFLGVKGAGLSGGDDPLLQLSTWLASTNNALFARVQVNRIWYHLMGRGLVDPVDDFRATNPASHPALLDTLSAEFVKSGYDLRRIIRLIMASKTYQRSSEPAPGSEEDVVNYSHNVPRRLPAETLLDCLSLASGSTLEFKDMPAGAHASQVATVRVQPGMGKRRQGEMDRFLKVFGKPPRQLSTECERSCEPTMSQTFQLIGGPTVQALVADPANALRAMAASSLPARQMVESLYWRALARPPTEAEAAPLAAHIDQSADKRAALEDVLWGLLNSKEFVLRK